MPNPHNRQPWQVDLSVDDQVTLTVDTNKLLPHTDPFSRQITIGLGCFIELLALAAQANGWHLDVDLFPQGSDPSTLLDDRPVASIKFIKNALLKADPLFAQVTARRSLKLPFDTDREVPDSVISLAAEAALLRSEVNGSNEKPMVAALRKITHEALFVELDTPRTYKESVDLFRIGKQEIESNPDGIDFSGRRYELLSALGLFTRAAANDKQSSGFKKGRDAVLANTDTAMAHLWLVTSGNTRVDQIMAGRDWMRIHLAVTSTGVALHPISQALQEYLEMKPFLRQSAQHTGSQWRYRANAGPNGIRSHGAT